MKTHNIFTKIYFHWIKFNSIIAKKRETISSSFSHFGWWKESFSCLRFRWRRKRKRKRESERVKEWELCSCVLRMFKFNLSFKASCVPFRDGTIFLLQNEIRERENLCVSIYKHKHIYLCVYNFPSYMIYILLFLLYIKDDKI
jgi:hypothetical protein